MTPTFLSYLWSFASLWSSAAPQLWNHLWQSTLFVAAVALLTFALRRYPARVRYWLWMAASVKFLIPFSFLIATGTHFAHPTPPSPSKASAYAAIGEMSEPFTEAPAFATPIPIAPEPRPRHHLSLPAILAALWLCGFAAVLAAWFIQWRRIAKSICRATLLRDGRVVDTLHRVEQLARVAHPIQLLSSSGPMEPGVFGIFRPVLLWPEAISLHLDDDHLEAVLAHEACHVRRRDNLTSLIHMLVEAIFWFYPLVWWMESQLVKERERACDEEVLLLCNRPQAYAESILKVCEFCAESPLKCVSGITGADLKRRVVRIVTNNVVRQLSIGARLLLLAAGLVAVSAPIMLGQMKGARVVAAVKASARAEAGALSFAARVASPIEPESTTPSNTLIPLRAVLKYQLKEPVKLAQAEAPEAAKASSSAQTGQTSSEADHAPFGWGLSGSKPANYRTGIDTQMPRDGLPSAYLVSTREDTGGFGTLSQAIQATEYAGKRVRLRAWVRSDNVSDWAGLWMRVDKGQTVISLDNMQQRAIHGSQPWMTYDVVLDVPGDATRIGFGILLTGPGEVWLNDVKLETVGQDVPTTGMIVMQNSLPTTPVNPDFQNQQNQISPYCRWEDDMKTNPENLNFADGAVGSAPKGWLLGQSAPYEAINVPAEQCHGSQQCATVHSLRGNPSVSSLSFLYQNLYVTQHRGQTLIYRAFVRVDPNSKGVGRLLVRVHRKDCSTTFRDDMGDHPVVSGEWAAYEIRAPIAADAYHIEFGVQLVGAGEVWIDQISMEFNPAVGN